VVIFHIKIYSSTVFKISNKVFRCCVILVKNKCNNKTSVIRSATFSFPSKLSTVTLHDFRFISQTGFDMSILIHFFSLALQIISSAGV
jgi:hypothetical protein